MNGITRITGCCALSMLQPKLVELLVGYVSMDIVTELPFLTGFAIVAAPIAPVNFLFLVKQISERFILN